MKNCEMDVSVPTVVLKIGDSHVSNERVKFKCYGLGSCVGLFLYDSKTSNSAGAHIMLPGKASEEGESSRSFTFDAIAHMITGLVKLGTEIADVRAKVVGGANVANISSITIGLENVESVKAELQRNNIPITSMHVGGTFVRSVEFYSSTKQISVTSIDARYVFPQTLISTNYV